MIAGGVIGVRLSLSVFKDDLFERRDGDTAVVETNRDRVTLRLRKWVRKFAELVVCDRLRLVLCPDGSEARDADEGPARSPLVLRGPLLRGDAHVLDELD